MLWKSWTDISNLAKQKHLCMSETRPICTNTPTALFVACYLASRNLGHSLITQTAALEQMIDSRIPTVHALWHTCHNCLFLFPSAFIKLTFIFEPFIFTQLNQFPLTLVYLVLTQHYFFWLQYILQWWRLCQTSINHTCISKSHYHSSSTVGACKVLLK